MNPSDAVNFYQQHEMAAHKKCDALQTQLAEHDRIILEQHEKVAVLTDDVEKWKSVATINIKENVDFRYNISSLQKQIADYATRIEELTLLGGRFKADPKALEAALKAEHIKALEQLADKVCTFQTRQGKLYITPREIRTMANELKEQS